MTEKVRVASVDDLASGEARQVDVGDTKVAVVRIDDDFYAVADQCSHANYSLSEGEVDCDDRTLECWKHGAQFSLLDGEPQTLPATTPVQVYRVDVAAGEVFVSMPGAAARGEDAGESP